MTRLGTAIRLGMTELRRTPVLIALLVVGPAYVIYVFTLVAPKGQAIVHLGDQTIQTTLPKAFPAFTTPMTAALVTGIAGLFLIQTAGTADSRLVVSGYRPYEVVFARLGILVGIAVIATGVSVGVMLTAFQPEHLGWYVVGTVLTALTYGMVGLLVGIFLSRLLGVYVILFGSMIDLFIFQNPLATDPPALATILPGHYPLQLVIEAGFLGDISLSNGGWTLAYLAVLTGLAIVGFYRETQVG
jgi:ABC-2 type transport system permease protein